MSASHAEELVYATSEDGFQLAGVAIRPIGAPARPLAVAWVHGNSAAFYDYPYVALGRALAALGYPVVVGNTRGHDILTNLWPAPGAGGMPTGGGAGWERLEESPRDLAAWVAAAAALGDGHVALAGHSAGAQKVVLYQAERADPRVAALVLASPDLRGHWPPGTLEEARRLVAEGRATEVLAAQPYAPWYRQTAQAAVSRAEVLARLSSAEGGEPALAAVRVPILAFAGAREPVGAEYLDAVRAGARAAARVDTRQLADADHFYAGREPEAATLIAAWLETLARP
jgi:hypothetical protein